MKVRLFCSMGFGCLFLVVAHHGYGQHPGKIALPYEAAGLSKREAAAHLLSRFTYGPLPGQVDSVVNQGIEAWFLAQLNADLPDDQLAETLAPYDALALQNDEVARLFPLPGQVQRMAIQAGFIDTASASASREDYRKALQRYREEKELRAPQELYKQLINQKVLRATFANNQLQEVMTSFWMNHFNVSATNTNCARFILSYERDAIRPNALGNFDDLLLATAKSPAMLYYLDNFNSSAEQPAPANAESRKGTVVKRRNRGGINENYAREVMELHTLGVDGGYDQQDVTAAARVLTGWTVYPMDTASQQYRRLERMAKTAWSKQGFVRDGDFLFAANRHDPGRKTVMGKVFGPKSGYQEGVALLEMLAHHPSTAAFISRKIAIRFVSDDPPTTLVDRMAEVFRSSDGDIRQVLVAMVSSPEFWSASVIREKTKSPFELAISAARALDAQVTRPFPLYQWSARMGEKVYYYQAPTGFPDRGQYWINTGSLLSRMNFGMALASGKVSGTRFDLVALNDDYEPESTAAALRAFAPRLLPERDFGATEQRLIPLLNDPELEKKVKAASVATSPDTTDLSDLEEMGKADERTRREQGEETRRMLAQVVGVIIGSPEFQRR
ncbi:DUF1800 domain-containing protein [Parapedobacter sp. DT-150]|uniref:DUF1800 domain-containing protein n=1 Tax=Parapedobacter sp. DT-150 TaxID=3396162 RepID=UPI003F1A483A